MKKYLLFVAVFLGINMEETFAQNFPWVDSANATLAQNNYGPYGFGICTDDSNNVFVTGGFSAFSAFQLNKYKSNGLLEWTRTGYTNFAVAADKWGNCYTTGYYLLQKYTSTGTLVHKDSAKIGSSNAYFTGNAISYDGGKYLYITGDFSGASGATVTFGTKSITLGTNPMGFILKCDTAGNVIWAKAGQIGRGPSEFHPVSINTNSNGGIYLTGYFADTVILGSDSVISTMSQTVAFVARYDTGGNVKWANSTGRYDSYSNSVSSDGAGNVYITGNLGAFPACFIAKYRSNGDSVWWRQCASSNGVESFGCGICTNPSGISFITGTYQGAPFGSLTFPYGGNIYDVFIVKYDSSGNAIWGYDPNSILPNSVMNSGYAAAIGNNLNLGCSIYFTGAVQAPAVFGSTIINLRQGNEFYVTELKNGCDLTSTPSQRQPKESLKVYPTPFTSSTTILFIETGKHQVEVEDMTGRILQQVECSGQQYELQRGSLTRGMYFIKVTDEQKNISVSKILVQ